MRGDFSKDYGRDFMKNNFFTNVVLRNSVNQNDVNIIEDIVSSTGFFSEEEVKIACELIEERLQKGEESGYYFLFLELEGKTIGYSCFGPIPATKLSYDLYWIAIHEDYQSKGFGKILLAETEKEINNLGGKRIYVETSGKEQYISTRKYYLTSDYKEEAVLEDFYAPGDSKYLYLKVLE